jgi:transposase
MSLMESSKRPLRQEIETLRRQLAQAIASNEALRGDNEALRGDNEALKKKIAELEELLTQARRACRRQAAPFRRSHRSCKPKKPGRKKGHPGARRPTPKHVDRTLQAPPLVDCPECAGPLIDVKDLENHQTELPPISAEVTRFLFQSGWCESCQKRVFSTHEEQTSTATGAAGHHLGPRLRAFTADLKSRLGIALRKIQDILRVQFNVEVSAGGLVQSNHCLAVRAVATVQAMKQELAQEKVAHADETGWRVAAENAWLWVICSSRFTIYEITFHRWASVVGEVLGESFEGFLMRDGWPSYDCRLEYRMLRCLLHLKRNAVDLEETQGGESVEVPGLFALWLDGVFSLKSRVGELSEEAYSREATELVEYLDEVVQWSDPNERNQAFVKRLAKAREHIVPILEHPELPATNNLGERQIRPIVVYRKLSAGNKTEKGAKTTAVLASLTATCHQQTIPFVNVAYRLLTGQADQPVRFWVSEPDPDPAPS